VSTGIAFGSLCGAGVPVPGVDGGVKAGLSRVFGGGESDLPLSSTYSGTFSRVSGLEGRICETWDGKSRIAGVRLGIACL